MGGDILSYDLFNFKTQGRKIYTSYNSNIDCFNWIWTALLLKKIPKTREYFLSFNNAFRFSLI